MALRHVQAALDPNDFVIVPNVAAVDEFRMTSDDGGFVATVDETFLDRLVAHMNEREQATGDLAPLVIGHTEDGQKETDAPPVVGYARNWHKGDLFNTGRKAAFFDAWINKADVETVKRYPRRSCEVWPNRFEVDPISLLGATTPARDLGLMRLARDGSFTIQPHGDLTMPVEEKKDVKPDSAKPPADPKESGKAKSEDGKIDQILALLTKLAEALPGVAGPGADPAAAAGAAPPGGDPAAAGGAPGGDQQMSDQEYEQMIQQMMQQGGGEPGAGAAPGGDPAADASRKGDEKVKNSGSPGVANTVVDDEVKTRLSRIEQENAALRSEVTKRDIKEKLQHIRNIDQRDVNPDDEALINDLAAVPPDIRARSLDRLKLSRPLISADRFHLSAAINNARVNAGGKKRVTDNETMIRLSRKASQEKKSFEEVAAAEGYDVS